MAVATLMTKIGTAIKEAATGNRISSGWYDPHMAAASRAVAERIPLVDFVLEVRDARVCKLLLLSTSSHCLLFNYILALQVFDNMPVHSMFNS